MKKTLLFLFLFFVFLFGERTFGQFALGVRIGYNGNKLTTNLDSIKDQFNNGFHIGAWTRIGKRFYVAPELLYTLSGAVFTKEGNLSTTGWKQKIRIGTLDIPVLLGFKIIHSKAITWRLELGPEVSFVVNEKFTNEGLSPPIQASDLNTANWYVIGGTGVDVLFLSFDVRYQYGLSQMIKDIGNYSFDTQNNLVLVSVGFKIFGKK